MKIKRFQRWRKVEGGDKKKFKFRSSLVKVEGDKSLSKDAPIRSWTKIILLRPVGLLGRCKFSMGFRAIDGTTKISNAVRKTGDGCFGMRLGPEDCEFFIASNDGRVYLEAVECVDIKDSRPEISKLCLY